MALTGSDGRKSRKDAGERGAAGEGRSHRLSPPLDDIKLQKIGLDAGEHDNLAVVAVQCPLSGGTS
ncbi:MAG: hypothetical protein JO273_17960 [Methylobacteriaceae bacterium]|nr:hypothetical protein [Methylobacteriaceae bacterium]